MDKAAAIAGKNRLWPPKSFQFAVKSASAVTR